ncbi:MAG: arylesterase [Desulfobacterales bacterium]|nr:arylesterase [Desulfobacterales bacterium]
MLFSRFVLSVFLFVLFSVHSPLWAADSVKETKNVLIIGDSLTAGLGVMPEQAYPALLQARLAEMGMNQVKVVNAGISGSTSAGAYARLKWYLKARPHLLILALGANDGLRGLSVAEMEKKLGRAISLAKEAGIKVVLAGMEVPPNYGPEYAADFRQVFPELAGRYRIPLIPFLLEGVAGKPALNQADGIHPNPEGHQIMADTILPYILENL